eukprot:TRINITY_DN1846_c3_g1_i2.p1 TRINITY_DN1846_c3_g1~~TRINITY_DN1846_c3_g1_i2.p1  ORF type:complete len:158 (+),score=31.40 TRINITY_DN1846_c3_g1_i2:60-476(+)
MDSLEALDLECGAWRPLPALGTPRADHALCSLTLGSSNVLVAVGGFNKVPLDSVELLDPREGKWRTLPPMQTPRYAHTACDAGDCGAAVLAVGGWSSCAKTMPRGVACELLDLRASRWLAVQPPAKPHSNHASVSLTL